MIKRPSFFKPIYPTGEPGVINPDYNKSHGMAQSYSGPEGKWSRCGCGFEGEDISEHTATARKLTLEALQRIDESKHVSYWCSIQDHCCCTDHDWDICNCICHSDENERAEERFCQVRLSRWKRARLTATRILCNEIPPQSV